MEDSLYVTSTAPNHIPYEGFALIEDNISGLTDGSEAVSPTGFWVVRNPVTSRADFRFNLREPGQVSIQVFDITGRLVKDLFRQVLDSGLHDTDWKLSADDGRSAAPGIYFVTFRTARYSAVRLIVLLN